MKFRLENADILHIIPRQGIQIICVVLLILIIIIKLITSIYICKVNLTLGYFYHSNFWLSFPYFICLKQLK